ncbi:MAG: hypothetical protein KAU48_01475, partial [Candidatus Thorarchaeota archaeon]|nr:hypothetical protein [Candidatus Thorarchaeota archaeon]
ADLEPGRIYSARIFAEATNYNPASSVFRIDLQATSTTIYLVRSTQPKMEVVYNEIITFYLNYTETVEGVTIDNATILWVHSGFTINETFTYNVTSGLWELQFNTSEMAFGTWGIAFYGTPGDPNLGEDIVDLTITVRKIVTEVISPIPETKYWGWTGYVTFFYNDTHFGGGISNASAIYQWGTFSGSAIDHGNGSYSIFINTTFLETGIRYPIIISFNKENYEVSSGGISLYIADVPTEIDLYTPTDNQIDDSNELQLPFGDSILISFFYNDTDDSDGYIGGLSGATITATIYGGGLGTSITFDVVDLGNGTYYFVFDSTSNWLFETGLAIPQAMPGDPFTLSIEISLP